MRIAPSLLLATAFCAAALAQVPTQEPARELPGVSADSLNMRAYELLSAPEPDIVEGIRMLTQAAGAGSVKAASNLGWLYIDGSIVERDYAEGARWLGRAADEGLPVAQSLLGDLYRDGLGMPADSVAADSLYRRAFEGGLADAGYKLAALREPSYEGLSAPELTAEGKYFYLRGAPSEGVKLFYRAADMDSAEAYTLLGDAYSRAIGVPYDHDLSLQYFVKGAEGGNPSAQFVVAEMLEIFPDALSRREEWKALPTNPLYWYEKAASAGVSNADEAYSRLLD